MSKSIEIQEAGNGFITIVYDGPHKTTWIHRDFPELKKYMDEQVRYFKPAPKSLAECETDAERARFAGDTDALR